MSYDITQHPKVYTWHKHEVIRRLFEVWEKEFSYAVKWEEPETERIEGLGYSISLGKSYIKYNTSPCKENLHELLLCSIEQEIL